VSVWVRRQPSSRFPEIDFVELNLDVSISAELSSLAYCSADPQRATE